MSAVPSHSHESAEFPASVADSNYRLVSTDSAPVAPNEVRLTASGNRKMYITYALSKLDNPDNPLRSILITAAGRASSQAVTVAEIVKRRILGLHQVTKLSAIQVTDVWEPLVEGLTTVTAMRRVPMISILLSRDPLDPSILGYQPPLAAEEVTGMEFVNEATVKHTENNSSSADSAPPNRFRSRNSTRSRGRGRANSNRGGAKVNSTK